MRSICFYFQIHQPMRLRTYRFFDIGAYHNYYDDYQNRFILRRVADKSYLPMNKLLMDLIKEYGPAFKVSFSISGAALDQIRMYAPDVLLSFQKLAATGNVEFLAETYAHSLSSLKSKHEFVNQVNKHREMIRQLFKQDPATFRNTELIYSDEIGETVAGMGFKTMLTEGAKHILGWKSPNFMYCNAINPKLKVLLRNYQLSDDIAFRFSERGWSEWPLTTEKFVGWLNEIEPKHEVVNLFMDYETFGEHQWRETGIFDFMRALPAKVFESSDFSFNTPSELADKLQPISAIHVQSPISWADEERDITAWLGNDLQDDAFDNLYAMEELVRKSNSPEIQKDWNFLQASDHFYYMCTKWFSDGDVHKYFNPYGSPYDAYINYMNVISDLRLRLEKGEQPVVVTPLKTAAKPGKAAPAKVKKTTKKAK
jgi:alpha-amylase